MPADLNQATFTQQLAAAYDGIEDANGGTDNDEESVKDEGSDSEDDEEEPPKLDYGSDGASYCATDSNGYSDDGDGDEYPLDVTDLGPTVLEYDAEHVELPLAKSARLLEMRTRSEADRAKICMFVFPSCYFEANLICNCFFR